MEALFRLAYLLEYDYEALPHDLKRAAETYNHLIRETGYVDSMFNFALLACGAEGLAQDCPRTMELYSLQRQTGDLDARHNLAFLVRDGANGVHRDAPRAARLLQDVNNASGECSSIACDSLAYRIVMACLVWPTY